MAKPPKSSPSKKSSAAKTGRTSTKLKPAVRESRRLNAEQKRSVLPSTMKPQISPQPPKTPATLKGMTLKSIYANTPNMMKENGRECVFKSFKKSVSPKGFPVLKAIVIHRDPFRPRSTDCPHTVTIIGIDNQNDPFSKQKRVFVQCDCVPGTMKVQTPEGFKEIYSIAEPFTGELSKTYLVDGREYRGTAPFHVGRKPVFRLSLSNGSFVEGTDDHRFRVIDSEGSVRWRAIKDIQPGDTLKLSKHRFPDAPDKTSKYYEQQFLGYMQGDGSVTQKPDLQIPENSDKLEFLDRLVDLGLVANVSESSGRGMIRVAFTPRAKELFSRYSYDGVNAPSWETHSQFLGYLSGLICADGTVSSNKGMVGTMRICGAESYLRPVFEYLLHLGLTFTRLRLERKAGTQTNLATSTKDMYALEFRAEDFKWLLDNLDLTSRFSSYEFKKFNKVKAKAKVTSKTYAGKKDVYDITVERRHAFVMDGAVVAHNCENFCYMWEYSLAERGATHVIFGNGEPPIFTNPSRVPGTCKHMSAVIQRVFREKI